MVLINIKKKFSESFATYIENSLTDKQRLLVIKHNQETGGLLSEIGLDIENDKIIFNKTNYNKFYHVLEENLTDVTIVDTSRSIYYHDKQYVILNKDGVVLFGRYKYKTYYSINIDAIPELYSRTGKLLQLIT